jgi:uncharacterized membrane protein
MDSSGCDGSNTLISIFFEGGTALAGLILVFLGGVLSAFDSFDGNAKTLAIRRKYKHRARLAFAGFIAALLTAGCALAAEYTSAYWLPVALVTLVISFLLLIVLAWISLLEVS